MGASDRVEEAAEARLLVARRALRAGVDRLLARDTAGVDGIWAPFLAMAASTPPPPCSWS
jgi:hypothetical protein